MDATLQFKQSAQTYNYLAETVQQLKRREQEVQTGRIGEPETYHPGLHQLQATLTCRDAVNENRPLPLTPGSKSHCRLQLTFSTL